MYKRVGKRAADMAAAALLLLAAAPVMAVVALLIRIKLGRGVLFRQLRPGLHEKPFWIYKFRTMADLYDADGAPLPDHQRFHPFGGMIRSLSLDELPQLINVLKGEMSLIGPRPLLPEYSDYYTAREKLRFTVRPGITGLAQVSGRNRLDWQERLACDVAYVERLSWRQDAWILVQTVLKVIRRADVVPNPGELQSLEEQRRAVKEEPA